MYNIEKPKKCRLPLRGISELPKIVDHADNRRLIAQAASKAIASKGVTGVTMMDIATAVGFTTGMISNYFNSKDDIIAAALGLSFERIRFRVQNSIELGEKDLAEIIETSMPVNSEGVEDSIVWLSFLGLIVTDDRFREMNAGLHKDGTAVYADAVRVAWQESTKWPEKVRSQVIMAILTVIIGLSVVAVTSPETWTVSVQKSQLRLQLQMIREWASNTARQSAQ